MAASPSSRTSVNTWTKLANDFEPLPPGTNIQRALEQIARKSAILSQPAQGDIERSHESEKAF
jgi:hypothetical protein